MPVSPRELRRAREGDEAFPPDCARKFKPERELAAGGFGTVWLATQRELDRPAAVKLLHGDALADREQRERFVNEARLTAKLASPHVVRVLDFGASDAGEPWIAYELCPGRSLRARLDEGPMDPRDALTIAAQMAEALAEAHGQGILHRDVKPENVLEFERGHYKLTDFGIAKWTQEASHTRTGIVLGTPAYLAPEAIAGESPSARSDVYALGVMLYEMLAGRLPFTDQNPVVLMERHLKMEPRPPSELRPALPARLDALVARAMAKKPGERYASAEEMRAALTEAAQRPRDTRGDTRPIVRERVAAAAPDAARGVPLPFAAAVALALAAFGFAGGRATAPRVETAAPPASPSPTAPAPAPTATPAALDVATALRAVTDDIDRLVDVLAAEPDARARYPVDQRTTMFLAYTFHARYAPILTLWENVTMGAVDWHPEQRDPDGPEHRRKYFEHIRNEAGPDSARGKELRSWRRDLHPMVRRAGLHARALAHIGTRPGSFAPIAHSYFNLLEAGYVSGAVSRGENEKLLDAAKPQAETNWGVAYLLGFQARRCFWVKGWRDGWIRHTGRALELLLAEHEAHPDWRTDASERVGTLDVVSDLSDSVGGLSAAKTWQPVIDRALAITKSAEPIEAETRVRKNIDEHLRREISFR